jgi:hypothetical protein
VGAADVSRAVTRPRFYGGRVMASGQGCLSVPQIVDVMLPFIMNKSGLV